MTDFTPQQSQRSMAASYAKDIMVKLYEVAPKENITDRLMFDIYDSWFNHILQRMTEGQITDKQIEFIEQLLELKGRTKEEITHITTRMFSYTMEEASKIIDFLMSDGLPQEYQDNMNAQYMRMKATQERVLRDNFYDTRTETESH